MVLHKWQINHNEVKLIWVCMENTRKSQKLSKLQGKGSNETHRHSSK